MPHSTSTVKQTTAIASEDGNLPHHNEINRLPYRSDSVESYDFIPSPHNKYASLNGPPRWHENNQKVSQPEPASSSQVACGHVVNIQTSMTGRVPAPIGNTVYVPALPFNMWYSPSPHPSGAGANLANLYASSSEANPWSYEGLYHPPNPVYYGTFMSPPPSEERRGTSIEETVEALMRPEWGWVSRDQKVTIQLDWVCRIAPEHMTWDNRKHRKVLKLDSELLRRGVELGMPEEYMKFLQGEGQHNNIVRLPLAQFEKNRN